MGQDITSGQLLELLRQRHANDVFIPQCKDGPTWCGSHRRMDAWAMRRSWANPCTWGYEIKVSRSDFLADSKWRDYLHYCNELYFVTPPGLIDQAELPETVGLIVCSKNGTRLYVKRKAVYRDIDIPEQLWRYVLMWRAKITDEDMNAVNEGREYWQRWLARKDADKHLGDLVGRRIRSIIAQRIEMVEVENRRLVQRMSDYERICKTLAELGYDPDAPPQSWALKQDFQEKDIPVAVGKQLGAIESAVRSIRMLIE